MNSYYGSIAESNGGSGSDGWVPDGDSYKYVNDKTKGVKEKVFIDPATGKTMHGDENGNLVEVPQELMDVVVSGTRHVTKRVGISSTFDPSGIVKFTTKTFQTPSIGVEGYTTKTAHNGSSPVEAVLDGRTGKPESTTFSTQVGMVNLSLSCGVNGSVTVGNGFLSLGTTADGRYIFDLSIPTGSSSSIGTTFYYNPDIFINNMRYWMNTAKDALRSSSPAFYPIPIMPLPILIP